MLGCPWAPMVYRDRAMFVTFEGLDGSGKTTQVELLAARLEAEGRDVVATREPGGTELGEQIRGLVLHGGHVVPWAEAALYAASRAQHVEEVIRPALGRGAVVLCDRYVDSSVAYQGVGRGLGLDRVLELNLAAVGGLMPDRTFLLRLDPGAVSGRLGAVHDRLERAGDAFHARVAAAYDELAERFSDRIVVVDASLPRGQIAETIAASLGVSV
jgi:dTMP kinase